MDFSTLKAGDKITYIGDSFAFGGTYLICRMEETFVDKEKCPPLWRDELIIIEFTNDGEAMYFPISNLKPEEWEYGYPNENTTKD